VNTLTKLALGLMGQLKPLPPVGDATPSRTLLSQRVFAPEPFRGQAKWLSPRHFPIVAIRIDRRQRAARRLLIEIP
jgi:hypothetical protein